MIKRHSYRAIAVESRTDIIQLIILFMFTILAIKDSIKVWDLLNNRIDDLQSAIVSVLLEGDGFFLEIFFLIISLVLLHLVYVNSKLGHFLLIFNLVAIQFITSGYTILDFNSKDDYFYSGLPYVFSTALMGFLYPMASLTDIELIAPSKMIIAIMALVLTIAICIYLVRIWRTAKPLIFFAISSIISNVLLIYVIFESNLLNIGIFQKSPNHKLLLFAILFFAIEYIAFYMTGAADDYHQANQLFEKELGINDFLNNFSLQDLKLSGKKDVIWVIVVAILFILAIYFSFITSISDVTDLVIGSDIQSFGSGDLDNFLDLGNPLVLFNLVIILFTSFIGGKFLNIINKVLELDNNLLSFLFDSELILFLSYFTTTYGPKLLTLIFEKPELSVLAVIIGSVIAFFTPIISLYSGLSSFVLALINYLPFNVPSFIMVLILYLMGQMINAIVNVIRPKKAEAYE